MINIKTLQNLLIQVVLFKLVRNLVFSKNKQITFLQNL